MQRRGRTQFRDPFESDQLAVDVGLGVEAIGGELQLIGKLTTSCIFRSGALPKLLIRNE